MFTSNFKDCTLEPLFRFLKIFKYFVFIWLIREIPRQVAQRNKKLINLLSSQHIFFLVLFLMMHRNLSDGNVGGVFFFFLVFLGDPPFQWSCH